MQREGCKLHADRPQTGTWAQDHLTANPKVQDIPFKQYFHRSICSWLRQKKAIEVYFAHVWPSPVFWLRWSRQQCLLHPLWFHPGIWEPFLYGSIWEMKAPKTGATLPDSPWFRIKWHTYGFQPPRGPFTEIYAPCCGFMKDMCVCASRKVQWAHAGNMRAFVGIFHFIPSSLFFTHLCSSITEHSCGKNACQWHLICQSKWNVFLLWLVMLLLAPLCVWLHIR